MRRLGHWVVLAGVLLAGGVSAVEYSKSRAARLDCPGKIVCPLTGNLVCRDRCPIKVEQKKGQGAPACCQKAN
ncbi:MAG: hypothetical protein HYX75_13795 [Acidobacteria bacterium]|nr:hypothetical protein [Acidobacteriota bacterium]